MKRIILAIIAIAAVGCLVASPYNIFGAMENKTALEGAISTYNIAVSKSNVAEQNYIQTKNDFDNQRTFEVYYGDISNLVSVLGNVASVSVSSVTCCYPKQNFAPAGAWQEGMDTGAVCITLLVEDTTAALQVLSKMELPYYSIYVTQPNMVEATFLTGGGV